MNFVVVWGFLCGVRGEFTDDVSETAASPIFTGYDQKTIFISRWKSKIMKLFVAQTYILLPAWIVHVVEISVTLFFLSCVSYF
jgi:hypothetical protein